MQIVNKNWGTETWLELNDKYCYKKIFFRAGQRCSLQYHEYKLETIYVESGEGILRMEVNPFSSNYSLISGKGYDCYDNCFIINGKERWARIWSIPIKEGFVVTIRPNTIHRIEATTDLTTLEVSTPEVDDCIRVQDDWNRPNGRIESEHE